MTSRYAPLSIGMGFFGFCVVWSAVATGLAGCTDTITSTPNRPPTVTISSPAEGASYKPDAAVPLLGTVSDPDAADTANYPDFTIKWTLSGTLDDGTHYQAEPASSPPTSAGEIRAQTDALPIGAYTVQLQAWDTREGVSELVRVSFLVENQPPTIEGITCPTGRLSVAPGDEVQICGSIDDPDDPEDSVVVSLLDALEEPVVFGKDVGEDGNFTLTVVFAVPGEHLVYVRATDPNGGYSDRGPVTIYVRDCSNEDLDGDGISGCEGDCDDQADPNDDRDDDGYPGCDPVAPDCDDDDASVHPGAAEGCDGKDTDCDGVLESTELDQDGDGFFPCLSDCDDADPLTYPGAAEICDGVDNDCDLSLPDSEEDRDGDGYVGCGDCVDTIACGDCDDGDADVAPNLAEVCGNGIDDNCNNLIDEDYDADADGYTTCDDCDDGNPDVYPGADEGPDSDGDGIVECDGIDNDCDRFIDDDASCTDDDGDGYSELDGDCDDRQFYTWPGAPERPDRQDNDCDGAVDEGIEDIGAAHLRFSGDLDGGEIASSFSSSPRGYDPSVDLNGDGYADVVIGAYHYDVETEGQDHGAAFVLFGRATADWAALDGAPLVEGATLLTEESAASWAGYSVALAGDLNGDGFGDFAVGAPHYSSTGVPNVGRVYIVFGKALGWGDTTLTSAALSTLEGLPGFLASYTFVGWGLAGGADVNGDGFDDLVVGAPYAESESATGWAYVVPGGAEAWPAELRLTDVASVVGYIDTVIGRSVAIAGYVNGDGTEDFAIGAFHNVDTPPGSVFPMLGNASFVGGASLSIDELDGVQYYGTVSNSYIAESLSGQVDVDNDGFEDILVGRVSLEGARNMVYVVRGTDNLDETYSIDYRAGLILTTSEEGGEECPCIVQGIGDMNGDGRGDFAVGLPQSDLGGDAAGAVYIFHGRDGMEAWGLEEGATIATLPITEADMILSGENPGDRLGAALGAGDLNGDGWQDLLIGAPGWDSEGCGMDPEDEGAGCDWGRVYVLFGYPPGRNPAPDEG